MLLRRPALVAILLGVVTLATMPSAFGQGGNDVVKFRDRKKDNAEGRYAGELTESAAGISVKAGGKVVGVVSPADVLTVEYTRLPGLENMLNLRQSENKDVVKARNDYLAELKKNPTDPRTRRYLEFKDATLSARIADSKNGEEFKAEAATAVEKLATFARTYAKSWEVWPTARTAARLQAELGKTTEATAILANLAKNAELPVELRLEARLAEIDVLLRSSTPTTAASAITELAGMKELPATGSSREKLKIYQAMLKGIETKTDGKKPEAAVKEIEDLVTKTTDASVRAVGHNSLGQLYTMVNLPRDAMWEYLWVETVYNQDRSELIKAVASLEETFTKLGDKDRADIYKAKLPSVKAE